MTEFIRDPENKRILKYAAFTFWVGIVLLVLLAF